MKNDTPIHTGMLIALIFIALGICSCAGMGGIVCLRWAYVWNEARLDREDPFRHFR
jgi:hypothetical protein